MKPLAKALVSLCVIFGMQVAVATPLTFSGVSVEVNGSADVIDDTLRLTPAIRTAGSAFATDSFLINPNTSFFTTFSFRISGSDGTGGADGFAFVVQNDPDGASALGTGGGFLGYAGIDNSLAIEFDTFQNSGVNTEDGRAAFFNDPDDNHIGVNLNGEVVSEVTTTPSFNLNSGDLLYAWANYDGKNNLLSVFVSETRIQPLIANLSFSLDLPSLVGRSAYAGFTAGTGALTNIQDIEAWSFRTIRPVPEPNSGLLLVLGLIGFAIKGYIRTL